MSFKAIVVPAVILGLVGIASASPSPSPSGDVACKHIEAACKAAGYVKDGKDKNLERDCVTPILEGNTVPKVPVTSEDVVACKAYRAPKKD
jgi:hypothetical protein